MSRIFFFSLFLLLTVPLNAGQLEEFHSVYGGLLERHLRPQVEREGIVLTLVDYRGWSEDPAHFQAMEILAAINPAELEDMDAMAFWINAYNLLTIDLILGAEEKESIKHQGGMLVGVWRKHFWPLYNGEYSLHQIEHKILRPMGDARIHFAINCASLSCPDLRTEPYIGALLDWQLEDQERAFILNPTKGMAVEGKTEEETRVSEIGTTTRLREAGKEQVSISALFFWYKEDFGGREGIRALINKYRKRDLRSGRVKTLPYDWSLNGDW